MTIIVAKTLIEGTHTIPVYDSYPCSGACGYVFVHYITELEHVGDIIVWLPGGTAGLNDIIVYFLLVNVTGDLLT